jgi:hypothetical protein
MEMTKICPWCDEPFDMGHGNSGYCCKEHQDLAKRERQKKKRDCYKKFIPLFIEINERLEEFYQAGKTDFTKQEIENYGLDISLSRLSNSLTENGTIIMDFGDYYFKTQPQFTSYKLFKDENTN